MLQEKWQSDKGYPLTGCFSDNITKDAIIYFRTHEL